MKYNLKLINQSEANELMRSVLGFAAKFSSPLTGSKIYT